VELLDLDCTIHNPKPRGEHSHSKNSHSRFDEKSNDQIIVQDSIKNMIKSP